MAQPVWVLSVDLQTKTATFQSGMAGAAKTARGAFTEIKAGASEMGGHVSTNMFASRHAIMAVSEAFGDTMPRAITALLVHIGPLGAALEAAFPFAAIGLAAVLLVEHLAKLHEEGQKLTLDQERFGTAVNNAFNSLDNKLLQSQIKTDELRNDHIGALAKELELIDNQSMGELVHTFEELAKAADVVFEDLKSHWYTFGIGSTGAKHALDDFKAHYDNLMSAGKSGEAADLLKGTRESAEHILAMQQQAKANSGVTTNNPQDNERVTNQFLAANAELKKAGVRYTEKEIESQQTLVDALRAQEQAQVKIAAIKDQDSGNAKLTTAKTGSAEAATAAKQAAESRMRIAEQVLAGDRAMANASLAIQRATLDEREAVDVAFANREYEIQLNGNQQQIAALDRMSKEYPNQLRALHEKAEELAATHAAHIAEINAKGTTERAAKDLTDLEQSEREKIAATDQGSAARLAVIEAAIQAEQRLRLEDTSFYRELLTQRAETTRKAAEEEAKQAADTGRLIAENEEKMGELALAAYKEHQALLDSARRVSRQQRIAEEIDAANQEAALKITFADREIAALDKQGKDYENKLRALQNKQKQLIQAHENEITAIKERAEIERNQKIHAAEEQYAGQVAKSLTQVLMGHQSFASAMRSLGNEVVSGLMEQAIKHVEMNLFTKQSDAALAARRGFNAGLQFPFPANLVMAPALGAGMYAQVMAFAGGTDSVPGYGVGDHVPAMLTPGEGVVPGGVMDGLRKMVQSGGLGGGTVTHVHVRPVFNLQALDTTGMEKMLDQHSYTLSKHVKNELRKLNN